VPVASGVQDAAVAPLAARNALRQSRERAPAAVGDLAAWEKLGLICSANERRADDASRDVEAWLKSYYMRSRVGEIYSGTVSSVVPFGVFVVLDDLYVEGLVHVSELGSEYFLFNEALHELRGERTGLRYRLGDRVNVQVARVDLEARRIEFRLVRGETRKAILAAGAAEPNDRAVKVSRNGARAAPWSTRASRVTSTSARRRVPACDRARPVPACAVRRAGPAVAVDERQTRTCRLSRGRGSPARGAGLDRGCLFRPAAPRWADAAVAATGEGGRRAPGAG
jgi:predicted RNA-binding protein with RPS1 domain